MDNRHTQNTRKLNRDISTGTAVFVVCSQTFTLFRLRKTSVPVEIPRYSFRVFVCACPLLISSIPGKSFYFPFPYFVIFVLQYFPFHMVFNILQGGLRLKKFQNYWSHLFDCILLISHSTLSLISLVTNIIPKIIKNVKTNRRMQHLPDSGLQTSLERREPGEKIKYIEISANTVAFISCKRRLHLQLKSWLFTGFSLLQRCLQT